MRASSNESTPLHNMPMLAIDDGACTIGELDPTHGCCDARDAKRLSDRMHHPEARDHALAIDRDPRLQASRIRYEPQATELHDLFGHPNDRVVARG